MDELEHRHKFEVHTGLFLYIFKCITCSRAEAHDKFKFRMQMLGGRDVGHSGV